MNNTTTTNEKNEVSKIRFNAILFSITVGILFYGTVTAESKLSILYWGVIALIVVCGSTAVKKFIESRKEKKAADKNEADA